MAVAEFSGGNAEDSVPSQELFTASVPPFARDAPLRRCPPLDFRTSCETPLWPIEIDEFALVDDVRGLGVDAPSRPGLRLVLRTRDSEATFSDCGGLNRLRLFLSDPDSAEALYQAILLGEGTFVRRGDGRVVVGPRVVPAGVALAESVLPAIRNDDVGGRLLTTWFAAPALFRFLELPGLDRLVRGSSERTLELLFVLDAGAPLRQVDSSHIRLRCAPIVNQVGFTTDVARDFRHESTIVALPDGTRLYAVDHVDWWDGAVPRTCPPWIGGDPSAPWQYVLESDAPGSGEAPPSIGIDLMATRLPVDPPTAIRLHLGASLFHDRLPPLVPGSGLTGRPPFRGRLITTSSTPWPREPDERLDDRWRDALAAHSRWLRCVPADVTDIVRSALASAARLGISRADDAARRRIAAVRRVALDVRPGSGRLAVAVEFDDDESRPSAPYLFLSVVARWLARCAPPCTAVDVSVRTNQGTWEWPADWLR